MPSGACNPRADPDLWHRCHIAYDDVQLYRQSTSDVVRRLDRALRIADPFAPFWRLEFLNGVVTSINSEKINPSRYSAAEKARLEGDVARAIQMERNDAVEQAQAQRSLERQLAEQLRVLRQQCRGVPTLQAAALEEFANFLRVNPAKIELNRVEFDDVWSACRGIFGIPRAQAVAPSDLTPVTSDSGRSWARKNTARDLKASREGAGPHERVP